VRASGESRARENNRGSARPDQKDACRIRYQYIRTSWRNIRPQRVQEDDRSIGAFCRKNLAKEGPSKGHKQEGGSKRARQPGPGPRGRPRRQSQTWTPEEVARPSHPFPKSQSRPKGSCEHLHPFTLMVAVVCSAQATMPAVNRATARAVRSPLTPTRRWWRSARRSWRTTSDGRPFLCRSPRRKTVPSRYRRRTDQGFSAARGCRAGEPKSRSLRCAVAPRRLNFVLNHGLWRDTPWRSTPTFSGVGNRTGLAHRGGQARCRSSRTLKSHPSEFMLLRCASLADPAWPYTCLAAMPRVLR